MLRIVLSVSTLVFASWAIVPERAHAADCDGGDYDGAYAGDVLLPQNWNCAERQAFWFTDQGSEIIPYSWFLHLEQADSSEKFVDPGHIDRLRYLPQRPTAANPDGLPIGFTKGSAAADSANGAISGTWLGMNCAACHTGQIAYDGKTYLIDGGPTMGDFEALFARLVDAMRATLLSEAKFARFAKAVIDYSMESGDGGTLLPGVLYRQLEALTATREAWNQRNRGATPYGHARLDAVGSIFNEIAVTALDEAQNLRTANAPVSYPFLWDTPQHDFVEWNGAIQNKKMGAVIRNVGEVLGVFGMLDLNTDPSSRKGHANSIDMNGLAELESLLVSLWSPRWEDTSLPPIDRELAARGEPFFQRVCSGCHRSVRRDDPAREVKAVLIPAFNPKDPDDPKLVGTDPTASVNFLTRKGDASKLAGQFRNYWRTQSDGAVFAAEGDQTEIAGMLGYAVMGAITHGLHEDPKGTLAAMKAGQPAAIQQGIDRASALLFTKAGTAGVEAFWAALAEPGGSEASGSEKNVCFEDGTPTVPCYKARSLNGIWATAPYLHNGSVRTLRQLLTPPDQREVVFKVGTRAFDPDDIGFVDEGASILDTNLPGNARSGHAYGTEELTADPELLEALLEYLKTL